MIRLQSNAPLIAKILREQTFLKDKKYRWASFVFVVPHEDGRLLYNVLTKELLYITNEEFIYAQEDCAELVKRWFLVLEQFDDKNLIEQIKRQLSSVNFRNCSINNYTIFTTTDCNARCSYCFERNYYKVRMNNEVISATTDFIKRNCQERKVNIQWFGGEPLFNMKAIDKICHGLSENGITFTSSMTTNGYLFSESIIDKALSLWRLKDVQITLDGTEKNYNKIKSYIYKNKNPYLKVTDNIKILLSRGIKVTIRLNLTTENADDLRQLITKLIADYSGNTNFSIYVHPLFELINESHTRKEVFKRLMSLHEMINDSQLGQEYSNLSKPRIHQCKADANGKSVVIFPDGHIGLCDHQWQSDYIGHVESDELDYSIIERWKEYNTPIDRCGSCLLYPDCLKLRLCETNNQCFEEFIEFNKFRLKIDIINKYNKYKNHYENKV